MSSSMAMATSTMVSMSGMSMATTGTAAAASASSTSHSMSGMDMGGGNACKISMMWNWYTIDACFISSQWHITSSGMFAGSCIGVILLVVVLEFLRRLSREYDRFIVRQAQRHQLALRSSTVSVSGNGSEDDTNPSKGSTTIASRGISGTVASGLAGTSQFRPHVVQQMIRALLHMLQFAVAYFIMLLAMYYNGYIIICIFIGAYIGAFIFSWETISIG